MVILVVGNNWSLTDFPGYPNDIIFDPLNQKVVFVPSFPGGLYKSTDGLQTWSTKNRGLPIRSGGRYNDVDVAVSPLAGRPGDPVTIKGRNFGSTQGSSSVSFGTVSAGTASSWTNTQIATRVPPTAATGPITVIVGTRKSNSFEFVLLPKSGDVEPTSGPASGGTKVTILAPSTITLGSLFNVLFDSTLARDIRVVPPNIIVCVTPPGSGTVDISVSTAVTATKVGTFTYHSISD